MTPIDAWLRTGAMVLLGAAALWAVLAATGFTPGRLRLRRSARQGAEVALLCGACGHTAVALERVTSCPECGADYATVGLDAPATGLRWGPPLPVLALLLLGLTAFATLEFSPAVARWANLRSIGSPELERWRSRAAMMSGLNDPATGTQPALAIEVDRDFVGPASTPPGASHREPLHGMVTVRLTYGTSPMRFQMAWARHSIQRQGLAQARTNSLSNSPPPAYPGPATLGTPWDQHHASVPTLTLRWRVGADDWTLTDDQGSVVESGGSVPLGIRAAFDRTGLMRDGESLTEHGQRLLASIESALRDEHALRLDRYVLSEHGSARFEMLNVFGEVTATPARLSVHPASPWGFAAALAVPSGFVLLSIAILWLAVRARRRATT